MPILERHVVRDLQSRSTGVRLDAALAQLFLQLLQSKVLRMRDARHSMQLLARMSRPRRLGPVDEQLRMLLDVAQGDERNEWQTQLVMPHYAALEV